MSKQNRLPSTVLRSQQKYLDSPNCYVSLVAYGVVTVLLTFLECFVVTNHIRVSHLEVRKTQVKWWNVLFLCVLKVVRNSFSFSIPTELYERLTRL